MSKYWLRCGIAALTTGASYYYSRPRMEARGMNVAYCLPGNQSGVENKKLPYYTVDEVAEHNMLRSEKGVWVTHKAGVYDITDFVKKHPGGEKRIMLAAGSSIDKWWHIFNIHDDDAVRDILEGYRIGNLKGYKEERIGDTGMWKNEPKRSSGLDVLNSRPFNAQSPEGILTEFITPNELFYVRNHMPVPTLVREKDFCMEVNGDGLFSHCFSVEELKRRFEQHTLASTIQCGGNRRTEMAAQVAGSGEKVKGLAWTNGGIANATWTGVWLRDVIAACQLTEPENPDIYHVQFQGADSDAAGNFHVSIPYNMAMNDASDVLIAFKMNGEDIPYDHGFPLRAIVPGVVGVRNCKWLQQVTVQPFEAQSVWQQNDYKNFPSWERKPDPNYPSVYYMPVQSSLTDAAYEPAADAISLKAYAYSGGGTAIQRVDVSYDGGKTFEKSATVLPPPPSAGILQEGKGLPSRKAWSWRQVESTVPVDDIIAAPEVLPDGRRRFRTCIRAITEDNAVQPATASFNFRGLLYNGYSCRDVVVE